LSLFIQSALCRIVVGHVSLATRTQMPPGNNCPSGRGAKAALVERRNGLPLLPMKMRVILEEKTDAVLALILVGLSGSVALGAHGWRGLVRYSHRLAGAGIGGGGGLSTEERLIVA